MGNFFANMSGMLKTGWNMISTPLQVITNPNVWTGTFFPQQQKTTIVPSNVSNQPYTTYQGVRPVTAQAQTITPWYQSWWNTAKEKAVNIGGSVSNYFAGMNIVSEKNKTLNTLSSTVGTIARSALSTLPEYFNQKWGLTPRGNTGDVQGNLPSSPQVTVLHYDPTQNKQAATQPGLFDSFLGLMGMGSQPKGEYNTAYPQQEAAPTMIPYPISAPQGASGKMNMGGLLTAPNMIMFAALGVGLWFVLKKKAV